MVFQPTEAERFEAAVLIASQYPIREIAKMFRNPYTNGFMTEDEFREAYAEEINNGGLRASMAITTNMAGIAAFGPAAQAIKAGEYWQRNRDAERWQSNSRSAEEEAQLAAEKAIATGIAAIASIHSQKRALEDQREQLKQMNIVDAEYKELSNVKSE